MVFYETTYILHSALQEGRLNDIVNIIEKKAESLGAKILFSDNWGRKKLSYLIEKEKYGTYLFFQYKIEDISKLAELSSEFEHNPNVLRYLNIKIEESEIKEPKTKEIVETKKSETSKEETTKVVKKASENESKVKEEPKEVAEKSKEESEENKEVTEAVAEEVKEKSEEVTEEENQKEHTSEEENK
tara:strand:+ start:1583 stop:2143 length:561 start_codon:yes stop_codon:yes gene_type:complete